MGIIKKNIDDPQERGRHAEAGYLARMAVKKGWMKRLPCEICGDPKTTIHHEDYWRPFYVWFLCKKHHNLADFSRIELAKRPDHEEIENLCSLQYESCKKHGTKILQGLPQRSRAQAPSSP
jgi:hypothetical protein